jgi:hypothetical protein
MWGVRHISSMRLFSGLSFFLISFASFAGDFGDLVPAPTQGNKWHVSFVGTDEVAELEIIAVDDSSYSSRIKSDRFGSVSRTNYFVLDGRCFIGSLNRYDSENSLITTDVYEPPQRCYIDTKDMPFHEVFTTRTLDSNGEQIKTERRDRTYRFIGLEEVTTPSGRYLAEKINIVGSKWDRTLWRNKENALIQHRAKHLINNMNTTTVLSKGRSQ